MSAIFGSGTAYFAIRDIHDMSNLPGTDTQEFEFNSGTSNDNMLNWKQYMQYVLFGTQYPLNRDAINAVDKATKKDGCPDKTVIDILRGNPRFSKIVKLVELSGYDKLGKLEYPVTFFAPTNDMFDYILAPQLDSGILSLNALQAVKYHTLPYKITPDQLVERKLYLETDLNHQRILSDWTNGKTILMNPVSNNPLNPIKGWFPQKDWIVNITSTINIAGGSIFIIDRPLVFPSVL
jgi:uncharacterized surface protein with fasciclin (FAS1) repeats